MLKRLLQSLGSRTPPPEPPAPGHVEPWFGLINKMYREPPFDDPGRLQALVAALRALGKALQPNRAGAHAFLADDLAAWFRTLGFLDEPRFVQACGEHAADTVVRARVWRVHTLCWAAQSSLGVEGDYVDLGCYDGKTVQIIARYVDFARQARRYWVYDLFEDPPEEARKAAHGPQLKGEVEARLRGLGEVRVVAGHLPGSLEGALPARIAFAQLDLNSAEAELACLERVFDRLSPGAILVLDDYGFVRYRDSHAREKAFFDVRSTPVLELPTGQGLVVKR
jgi:O-methyltransferase